MRSKETIEANLEETQDAASEQATEQAVSQAERIKAWRWKPGQSGNPGGRVKGDFAAVIARAVFENNPELVYKAMAETLKKGSAFGFQVISDRAYGKLKEIKEVTGKDGGPLEYREVSEQELNERIAELERDLGLAGQIDEAGKSGIDAAREAKKAVAVQAK